MLGGGGCGGVVVVVVAVVVCWLLLLCSVRRLSGSMIFAIEKVKFLHGAGEVTLSGGRLVGVSVAIALPVENGCMVEILQSGNRKVFKISF